jgi:hypothetical protein
MFMIQQCVVLVLGVNLKVKIWYNMYMQIENSKNLMSGKFRFKSYDKDTHELVAVTPWCHNLISTFSAHGLNIVMRLLLGDNTYPLEITKAKIGTGTTPPTENDTNIETLGVDNILIANRTFLTNTSGLIEFFIPDIDLPDGNYTEFTTHCGEQLFSRSLIDPVFEKPSNTDTTCEYQYDISNVVVGS